jgi:hypothetical protein
MTSILKVDNIQKANGSTPTASDLGINTTGSVLQIQSTAKTNQSNINANINVGFASYPVIMSVNITPTSSSSKILINYLISGSADNSIHMVSTIRRTVGGVVTHPALGDAASGFERASTGTRGIGSNTYAVAQQGFQFLDSPSTTSQITYDIVGASESANTWHINSNGENTSSGSWSTRFVSTVTVTEIGG